MMHAFARTFRPGDPLPGAVVAEAATAAALPPLTPACYLQLRRRAAGLSIEQVAARIAPDPVNRPMAADLVRSLETPGIRARLHDTLDRLQAAFPFDPDVYRQLHHEPADRHPTVCRSCGGSAWDRANGCGGTALVGDCAPRPPRRGGVQ